MGSLFTKVFLAFWLAAVLLGGVLLGAQHLLGDQGIEAAQADLREQADTAAALWSAGGPAAVGGWLLQRADGRRLVLLDNDGERVLPRQRIARFLERRLPHPLAAGTYPLSPRRLALVAPLPGIEPPVFLATVIEPGRFFALPIWARLLIAVLITGLVSFLLSAVLTRRLRRLRQAARAVAAGDLNIRVGTRGGDEVAALARDFDRMAGHLRELLEGQRRLLRDVSHELRSPLARLRVALELAERDGDVRRALPRIAKEADELERLVADLLSLARLESGQSALERRPVAIDELLRQLVTDADFEAGARGSRVVLRHSEPVIVAGDPALLRPALENIIRNAVRFTAQGSSVEVALEPVGEAVRMTVDDHGPGVPAAELVRIFEPFARVGEGRDHNRSGYGLGLAITRRAIEAHGGSVTAENRPDGGLRVTVNLPGRARMAETA